MFLTLILEHNYHNQTWILIFFCLNLLIDIFTHQIVTFWVSCHKCCWDKLLGPSPIWWSLSISSSSLICKYLYILYYVTTETHFWCCRVDNKLIIAACADLHTRVFIFSIWCGAFYCLVQRLCELLGVLAAFFRMLEWVTPSEAYIGLKLGYWWQNMRRDARRSQDWRQCWRLLLQSILAQRGLLIIPLFLKSTFNPKSFILETRWSRSRRQKHFLHILWFWICTSRWTSQKFEEKRSDSDQEHQVPIWPLQRHINWCEVLNRFFLEGNSWSSHPKKRNKRRKQKSKYI